jgi:hypothetical protein
VFWDTEMVEESSDIGALWTVWEALEPASDALRDTQDENTYCLTGGNAVSYPDCRPFAGGFTAEWAILLHAPH